MSANIKETLSPYDASTSLLTQKNLNKLANKLAYEEEEEETKASSNSNIASSIIDNKIISVTHAIEFKKPMNKFLKYVLSFFTLITPLLSSLSTIAAEVGIVSATTAQTVIVATCFGSSIMIVVVAIAIALLLDRTITKDVAKSAYEFKSKYSHYGVKDYIYTHASFCLNNIYLQSDFEELKLITTEDNNNQKMWERFQALIAINAIASNNHAFTFILRKIVKEDKKAAPENIKKWLNTQLQSFCLKEHLGTFNELNYLYALAKDKDVEITVLSDNKLTKQTSRGHDVLLASTLISFYIIFSIAGIILAPLFLPLLF